MKWRFRSEGDVEGMWVFVFDLTGPTKWRFFFVEPKRILEPGITRERSSEERSPRLRMRFDLGRAWICSHFAYDSLSRPFLPVGRTRACEGILTLPLPLRGTRMVTG